MNRLRQLSKLQYCKVITIFTSILLLTSCGNRTPYSTKTVKSKIERKYNIKGQLKSIGTETINDGTNKYFYEETQSGITFWVTASIRSNYTSFFPWTSLLPDSKVYSDSYESILMMKKRTEALALAKKYSITLIPTDTIVNNAYDKIFLNNSDDIEPAAQLIFDLCALYAFPQKKSNEIDASVRLYKMIDDTIPPDQKADKDYTFTISYSSVSPQKAKEDAIQHSDMQSDVEARIKWKYTKPYLR